MLLFSCILSCFVSLAAALPAAAQTQSATEYTFSFPDAVHHVMQVEATFHTVPQQTLRLQMSRSSPGRYASFEFADNVFEERFTDGDGKPLPFTKPELWSRNYTRTEITEGCAPSRKRRSDRSHPA